ncbi:MAG: hypothetical protein K9J13_05720 [Saprospiraceae bacterium]|nr:hypothetical protein [Saprospiraceae bacterium]
MSTIELRHLIIKYLSQIDDISFLKAIKTIIESKAAGEFYELSEYQKKRIESGREQLKNGQTISHNSINKEIDQWLNSK